MVLGFLMDGDEDQVLLVHKTSPRWQRGLLNGVGGKMEPGGTPLTAMEREWAEETGADPVRWRHFGSLTGDLDPGGDPDPWVVYCYRARVEEDILDVVTREQNDAGEFLLVLPIYGILRDRLEIVPNLRWLLPMAMESCAKDWPLLIHEKAYNALEEG